MRSALCTGSQRNDKRSQEDSVTYVRTMHVALYQRALSRIPRRGFELCTDSGRAPQAWTLALIFKELASHYGPEYRRLSTPSDRTAFRSPDT